MERLTTAQEILEQTNGSSWEKEEKLVPKDERSVVKNT